MDASARSVGESKGSTGRWGRSPEPEGSTAAAGSVGAAMESTAEGAEGLHGRWAGASGCGVGTISGPSTTGTEASCCGVGSRAWAPERGASCATGSGRAWGSGSQASGSQGSPPRWDPGACGPLGADAAVCGRGSPPRVPPGVPAGPAPRGSSGVTARAGVPSPRTASRATSSLTRPARSGTGVPPASWGCSDHPTGSAEEAETEAEDAGV